jgi:hypothetical protein
MGVPITDGTDALDESIDKMDSALADLQTFRDSIEPNDPRGRKVSIAITELETARLWAEAAWSL